MTNKVSAQKMMCMVYHKVVAEVTCCEISRSTNIAVKHEHKQMSIFAPILYYAYIHI